MATKRELPAAVTAALDAYRDAAMAPERWGSLGQARDDLDAAILAAMAAGPVEAKHVSCANPDCEDGAVIVDYCATCEGPIHESCPTCKGRVS